MSSILYYPLIFDIGSGFFDLHDSFHNTTSRTDEWTGTVISAALEEVSFTIL